MTHLSLTPFVVFLAQSEREKNEQGAVDDRHRFPKHAWCLCEQISLRLATAATGSAFPSNRASPSPHPSYFDFYFASCQPEAAVTVMSPSDSVRICLLILLSLCAAANGQSTTEQPQCSSDSSSLPTQATVETLTYSYGGVEGFYNIATGIADGLHGKLTQELMQKFADVIKGTDRDIGGLVADALKNQAGFIIFIVIGLIFIIFFPLVGCCYCCCRCYCGKCGAKRSVFYTFVGEF